MPFDDLTVDEFKRLYYDELLTETQIAERLGTYQVAVNRFRKRHDLPTLGKTGRIEKQLPELTGLQRDLIVGSLLGDGGMRAPSPATARLSEGHSLKQCDYTDWKADILGPYISDRYRAQKRNKEGRVFHTWNYATRTTTRLRPFYDLFYATGPRVFPSGLPELMNPFVLAVWYLDDGGVMNKFHPRITFGLDDLSLERAIRALQKVGLTTRIHEDNNSLCLTFPGQDRVFYDLVGPHIPDCMSFKRPEMSDRKLKDENAKKLTVEVAQRLSAQGCSVAEIARRYGVGSSTARRRVRGERPKKMGRPSRKKEYKVRGCPSGA